MDGPVVRGARCPATGPACSGTAEPVLPLWIALRADVRRSLEGVTIAALAAGALPEPEERPAAEPAAWENP